MPSIHLGKRDEGVPGARVCLRFDRLRNRFSPGFRPIGVL
ncbi:hypothetical protein CDL12_12849 [Handroanthus impetiginosus]|uniref:Uncharacterized protein n=1 Tax=Handroanthus impetiginosus TaxID=429701 RepID=A0A2G9HAH4_9LAMI|nr:hypothetical protein CDL12_12849 [Handroanthus impetiginosus]